MAENNIYYYGETDSTNKRLRALVADGIAKDGTACVAESQTYGKGRNGRDFFSPAKTGIYLSVYICPAVPCEHIATVSAIASVCVVRAIKDVLGLDVGIKWINDIYLSKKKVGGILCEILSGHNSKINGVIVGIGINCSEPNGGFPLELKDIATSLNIAQQQKDALMLKIIQYVREISSGGVEWLSVYKGSSVVLGKDITVIPNAKSSYAARAIDIDDMGSLVVVSAQGKVEKLFSGEISIRL